MKYLNLLAALVILFSGLVYARDKSGIPEEHLLARHQVGLIKLGESINELRRKFDRSDLRLVDLDLAGNFTPALEIYLDGRKNMMSPTVIAEIGWRKAQFVVERVNIYDQRFLTKKGVGIGSSLGDLKKYYKVNHMVVGGSGIYAKVDKLDMSFELSIDVGIIPPEFFQTGEQHLIPDGIEIVSIIAY